MAYDELLSDALLALVPPTAELLPVGRRGHDGVDRASIASIPPSSSGRAPGAASCGSRPAIRSSSGAAARRPRRSREAGIAFEIVPGVSSALGAAAYAGIPLTHREVASSVTLTTGHEGLAATVPDGTLVLFMGGKRLAENLRRIVDGGRSRDTPAAYVVAADHRRAARRHRHARRSGRRASPRPTSIPTAPALVFVGEVVALRERVSWIESAPAARPPRRRRRARVPAAPTSPPPCARAAPTSSRCRT